jgi:hypothetical protein
MTEGEETTRGDRDPDEQLPGSVSNQNAEEQHPGQGGGGEHRDKSGRGGEDPSGGESKEGSQSTGNPANAG